MDKIELFKVFMAPEAPKMVSDVLMSGYIGQGPQVDLFEKDLQNFLDVERLITVNAGTSALHLALHLLKKPRKMVESFHGVAFAQDSFWPGIQPGDEVLATPLTCTASNWPILANGLKIKWVDVDEMTFNMDLDDLERKITSTTKVIMAVHWGGTPMNLSRLKEIQNKAFERLGFKPAIIEDGAHAFGTTFNQKHLGNHGNIVMHSFQAIKHLTSVDGGALILPYDELYSRGKLIRWFGIDRETNRKDFRCETDIPEWGFKFHMNDVNAVVGRTNLKHVKSIIQAHQDNAMFYLENLQSVGGLQMQEPSYLGRSAYWIFSMLVENRADFMKCMKEKNIVVSQVHERNDKHTCVKEFRSGLPTLDNIIPMLVSIPVGWWVTKEQRQYIVDSIKQGW